MSAAGEGRIPAVLIVDDDDDDRFILQRLLRRSGLVDEIHQAVDGSAALELLASLARQEVTPPEGLPPLLVLLDINMPGMGGLVFLTRFADLRESLGLEEVSVVMLTSSSWPRDREASTRFDFVRGYVHKMPETPDELRRVLLELL